MSDCTACREQPAAIPAEIDNRPGLSAIAYRIGTFSSFRAALLDAIHSSPELAGLRSRQSDDYSITLMELWSAVADILTFYQERIANEAYLRTATLRDSVLRLVRLIGYQLQPGLAATTLLAFTLEKAATTTIPVGLRVQSVPVGTTPPQKFETVESINADARFNSLSILPAAEIVQPLSIGRLIETLASGADLAAFSATLAPGDQLIAYTTSALEFLKIASVTTIGDRIRLQWTIPPLNDLSLAASGTAADSGLFKLGRTFRLFGQDAPSNFVAMQLADPTDPTSIRGNFATLDSLQLDTQQGFFLNGPYQGLKPGAALYVVATKTDGTQASAFVTIQSANEGTATLTGTIVGKITSISSPISGTATKITAQKPDGTGFKPGAVKGAVIYELIGPQLRLEPLSFPDQLSQPDIYLSGRRNGWSTVEVNRSIVKGVIQPGVTIAVSDLSSGREVILVDADPTTAQSASVAGAETAGDELKLSLAGNDVGTILQLGLDPGVAQQITAMASAPFASGQVELHNSRLQVGITIGQLPPQRLTLGAPIASSGTWKLSDVASALQNAIRTALPDAPEFAQAQAFNSSDIANNLSCLVVVPGVAGQTMTFSPTSADPDTIADLGLDPAHVRYLDGVLTGPLNITTPGTGTLSAQIAMLAPATLSFPISASASATASSLASAIASKLGTDAPLLLYVLSSNRILALPPVSQFERPAYLHLALAPDGPFNLDASTALLLGNVAHVSHGETVKNEVLGDGNASIAFPTFPLQKKPLTFLLGNGPHGAQSTLSVTINGVEWQEVATLYGAAPADQVYITRIADDKTATVEFGDGVTGARVTTGRANVIATYRTGLGLAGKVGANTLATLLDVPNGLKHATNPLPADGGADPQSLADARTKAPSTVRSFGRAVSLQDFEDIALATGEIAKASATWVWTGFQKSIFLTVAEQQGGKLSADGIHQLWTTLLADRDPNHVLLIDNYIRVPIIVSAAIAVDPHYSNADVQQAVLTALLSELSFDRLQFAQPIYLSHIYAVLQNVEGVVSVDIADLDFKNQNPAFRAAHGADSSQPQDHLFTLPARPGTNPGTVMPAELAWVEIPGEDISLIASGGRLS